MARLILMCGLPGSGKSTYIKNRLEEDSQMWISRDAIRFSLVGEHEKYFSKETLVYNTFINNIVNGLSNDYDVYADATHISRASRQKLLRRIPANLYDELDIVYIKVDSSVAEMHNELRAGTRAYVEPQAIRRFARDFSEPEYCEGFDNIYIYENNELKRK